MDHLPFHAHRWKYLLATVPLLLLWTGVAAAAPAGAAVNSPGAVYTMTNEATGNRVITFDRAADGTLAPAGSIATGGTGSGMFENSDNNMVLSDGSPGLLEGGDRFLFALNAGSNTVTSFLVRPAGLVVADMQPSGGVRPVSVTYHKPFLYILNSVASQCEGGAPSISGFTVGNQGQLTPIPGSTRTVAGGALSGCAQISFNPRGSVLVVSEKTSNQFDTYLVGKDGLTTGPIVYNQGAADLGPFGFTFNHRGQLLTTENGGALALQGGAASYTLQDDGTLIPISQNVRNGQTDTCWAVNTDDGKYVYMTNFQSGDITSYSVNPDGSLVLLNPIAAVLGGPESGAEDLALSNNSQYLYARVLSDGTIHSFDVEPDGSLTPIQVIAGIPPLSAIGLAAR